MKTLPELSDRFYKLATSGQSIYEVALGDLSNDGNLAQQIVEAAMKKADVQFQRAYGDTISRWFRGFPIWAVVEAGQNRLSGLRTDYWEAIDPTLPIPQAWYPKAAEFLTRELYITYLPLANQRLAQRVLPVATERQKRL